MKAKIAEIFESVQGEGLYVGEKQIFVRFFGCNLKCRYCDTKLNSFKEYEPKELLSKLKGYRDNYHSISFTGGEPLLHNEFLKELLKLTRASGFRNYLETNGTLPLELESVIEHIDIIAMDAKLPSSTGMPGFWEAHSKFLKIASRREVFIKAIVCASTKEEDLRLAIEMIKNVNKAVMLVLQPNSFEDDKALAEKLKNFRNICFQEKISTCVIPQIHKIIGLS
ncbi:MAG: 7-carboxy-7-deazaguanine synthase QueE [Candidatus Omnitrophota bacterium]|jgi:organic radical activating enzyme